MTPRRSSAVQKSRGAAPPGDASVRGCGENSIHFFLKTIFCCLREFDRLYHSFAEDSFDYSTQCLRVPSDRFPAQREAVSGPNQS